MKRLKGIFALLLLVLWGPAAIAGDFASKKACFNCTTSEQQSEKEYRDFKFSNASQPAGNQFQVPHAEPSDLPFLPTEFVFACPTLLAREMRSHRCSRKSDLQEGFFSRFLSGSISAQAP